MLKLKKLSLSSIGRFVDDQSIDFSALGNIIQVDGQNNNTSGSSGSGKSTIFKAAEYLLGLNDIPSSLLQSRLTKDGMMVDGEFDLDGKSLKIVRGKGRFAIEYDGVVTSGSSKLTEEKLDSILAMPRHLFRPMFHKRQGEGGFFLHMTPKETHEFLTDCLGLSGMRDRVTKIEEKIASLEKSKEEATNSLRALSASLKATDDAILAIGDGPSAFVDQAVVEILKQRAEESTERFIAVVESHKKLEDELESKRPYNSSKFDKTKALALKSKIEIIQKEIERLELEEKTRQSQAQVYLKDLNAKSYNLMRTVDVGIQMKQEATAAALHIRSIRECKCPTCDQSWVNEKSGAREIELLENLKIFQRKISESEQAKIDLEEIKKEIENLEPYTKAMITDKMKMLDSKREDLMSELRTEAKNEYDFGISEMMEFSYSQKNMKDRHLAEQEQLRGQANLDRTAFESAKNSFKSFEEQKARYENTINSLEQQRADTIHLCMLEESKLDQAMRELALAEEAKKAIKSYTSRSFDDALVEIGDMATRIIRHIPNMANSTIQFEGLRETKEGKVKEEVNAVITVDGEIGVPIKSLSGGELSAVDLAIDLAVIDLIEQKTGKGIDVFILDEPFTGLDTVSIEMTLEMLKNSNLSKRLILVDHNNEVKEMVESRITVVRDGSTSRIVQ